MKKLTICEDVLNPESWQIVEVDDLCKYLASKWQHFPETARIYHNHLSESNDVTPHCEADIATLQQLDGEFFVVIYPEGIIVLVIVAICLAAVAIGIAFLMRPKTPNQTEQSPNNQLSDRQNKARPNERIPDIVGTVRSTLDLIAVPYRLFFTNVEYEMTYMCASRGSLTVIDCMDGTTPVNWIDGEFVAVYGPNTSPNGVAAGESTPQATFGTNPLGAIPPVCSVQQSNCVNGQVLRAPNSGNLNSDHNIAFAYPDALLTNGNKNLDFTDYFVPSTALVPQYLNIYNDSDGSNASDPAGSVHSTHITGRYQIVSVTPTEIVLCAPGGGAPSTVDPNWNIIATYGGQASTYGHVWSIIAEGGVWIGPYIIQVADLNAVWCNFISQGGLFYVDDNGNQHGYTFTVQVGVQAVDANNNPIGDETFGQVNLVGSSIDKIDVGSSLQFQLPSTGAVQVRAQLLTPKDTNTKNSYCDQIKWRDLYGVSPVAATNFGNVTTAFAIAKPTQAALSVKERKINMLVTRNIPTWNNRNGFALSGTQSVATFSNTLSPSNNAADIFCFLALDPFIGRRTAAELNVPDIYAQADSSQMGAGHANGKIATYFGTFLATEFCATFDDSKVSFEESSAQLAQAINCIAYRRGSTMSLSFEAKTADSTLLFNHRNKLPDSETRTVTFGTLNDNDGIEYDYIDPNAPNYPDIDTTMTLYFPPDQSAQNPKKITSFGVRNHTQAMLNGWRLYQKLVYQNAQTEFEGTQEAATLILYNRILVADNTRSDTQDGQIVDQVALLIYTSQPLQFNPAQTYTVFLQHYDETVEAMSVTAGPADEDGIVRSMLLSQAPRLPLVYDRAMFAQTTYLLVGSTPTRSSAFLLAEKETQANGTYKLKAINYDDNYYGHDQDVVNGLIVPVAYGYGPQGYTGSGSLTPSGGTAAIAARTAFNGPTYLVSPMHAHNNAVAAVLAAPGTIVAGTSPNRTVTASGLVLPTDTILRADATTAAIILTLPISPDDGQSLFVKKIDASSHSVTVNGNSNLIDGAATKVITAQYGILRLEFDAVSSTWGLY